MSRLTLRHAEQLVSCPEMAWEKNQYGNFLREPQMVAGRMRVFLALRGNWKGPIKGAWPLLDFERLIGVQHSTVVYAIKKALGAPTTDPALCREWLDRWEANGSRSTGYTAAAFDPRGGRVDGAYSITGAKGRVVRTQKTQVPLVGVPR